MCTKRLVYLSTLTFLLVLAGSLQAESITGSAGMVVMQDGPNTSGDSFVVNVHYEAFDGIDASDPLGITPGKKQFAYILEYMSGNKKIGFFDVESINDVPIIEVATSINAISLVNGVAAGADAPIASVNIPAMPSSGHPAARFVYKEAGLSSFGLAGAKSVILVFTTDEKYDIQTSLAQMLDTSLGTAAEVVGPTECFGIIEGTVFCLECGPDGTVAPMEGITVNVTANGDILSSAVTSETGKYQFSDLNTGQYTVAIAEMTDYLGCSVDSVNAEVTCDSGAVANFCVCPPPCTQKICVTVVCEETGTAVPVPDAWLGISGPNDYKIWRKTNTDGVKCFDSAQIVPGSYKVKVKAPCGYLISGDSEIEFDLAECEAKDLVFYACPKPPCEETVCVTVVETNDSGDPLPVEGAVVKLNCNQAITGVTGADGKFCTDALKPGRHVATLEVPDGYRLCDGDNKTSFRLDRCEHEDITFELCKVTLGPCPRSPGYWKTHPEAWPIDEMWIGSDILDKPVLLNILNNMKVDGSPASSRDMSMKLAKFLIATKLNLAAGTAPKDIDPVVIAADEFLLYDYPPGSCPKGKGKGLARQLKNTLEEYILDQSYCQE